MDGFNTAHGIILKKISLHKGVARGGRWGSSPTLACHCPTLVGQRGRGGAAGFLVNSKNHIRIIEKSVLKEIKFTNLFKLI